MVKSCQTSLVSSLVTTPPLPTDAPLPAGTLVVVDERARFLDRTHVAGGSPWRLLRLSDASRRVLERWVNGGHVGVGEEHFARTLIRQGLVHPLFAPHTQLDDVDVIVPTRDHVMGLRRLLSQLAGLHVTVVDDGSLNATLVAECARNFGAELVVLETNVGPAGARNAGVRATNRPFTWFIDSDVEFDNAPDVLARLRACLRDPLVGAVAPRVRGGGGPGWRDEFEQRFSPLDMGPYSGLVLPGGDVAYVPSACLLVRREVLGDGFDPLLRTGEDVDFIWRLCDQGWLVRYVAEVTVIHRARENWIGWWRQRLEYGTSAAALAERHGQRLAPLRADVWTLLAWFSVVVRQPMIGVRITTAARNQLRARLETSSDDADKVATDVVRRGMVRAGAPLARSLVRTYGMLILLALLHPRLRRRALAIYALGSAWRWRHGEVRASDVPLALADDLAYGVGVWRGAWRSRSLRVLTPHLTTSSLRLRDVLVRSRRPSVTP